MGSRFVPCIYILMLPNWLYSILGQIPTETVWKQQLNISYCCFSTKPRHISFPEGTSGNLYEPTGSRNTLLMQLFKSSAVYSHSCYTGLFLLSSGKLGVVVPVIQPGTAAQGCSTKWGHHITFTPQSDNLVFWPWSLFSPSVRCLLTRDALAHYFCFGFKSPLSVSCWCSHSCVPNLPHLYVAGAAFFPQPFSQFARSLSLSPSKLLVLAGSRLLDLLPSSA